MHKKLFAFVLFTTPLAAQAAGFALIEQSGSSMGNAFAGGAAVAEDASTIYFNPAGMTYVQGTQVVGALHLIKPSAHFDNEGSKAALLKPLGGEGGDAGDLAAVPNFFFKTDINDTIKIGLGVSAPFGLKTEYNDDWMGRFQAVKSELKTININPSIAYKVNDKLSLGAGFSAMWAKADLTSAVNFVRTIPVAPFALSFGEGKSKVEGDDWGFGFNLGAIFQATPDTRIGLAYRSKITQKLDGDVKFKYPNVSAPVLAALKAQAPNSNVRAKMDLPETFSVSAFSRLNDTWDIMGDITWTRWSRFEELAVYRTNGSLLTSTQENWDNTMRYSLGVNYHYSDAIKLRAGIAYDQEAVRNEYRTARIPGNDRTWLALGAGWQINPNSKIDIGYAHLFISEADIDDDQRTTAKGRITGNYDGKVDILSMQYTHNF